VQFYLRDVLAECSDRWQRAAAGGLTNYAQLLSRIDRWRHERDERVVIVTFNYDYLLEMAAQNSPMRLEFNDMNAYVKRNDYKVIKPHGSINWGQLLDDNAPGSDSAKYMIDNAAHLHFTNDFRVTPQGEIGGKLVYPAIAIPVEGKSEYACPAEHMTKLLESLKDTTHILSIGWRASENHFLADIKEGQLDGKHVHVVAGGLADAEKTKTNLLRAGMHHPDFVTCSSAGGFSDFLADLDELESFLRR
jgi:hypothetical protein